MLDPELFDYCVWYYPSINRFTDYNGNILHNFLPYFQTWEIENWKKNKDYGLLTDHFGNNWEFYYPDEDTEEYLCSHRCLWCPNPCDIRKLLDKYDQEQILIKGE